MSTVCMNESQCVRLIYAHKQQSVCRSTSVSLKNKIPLKKKRNWKRVYDEKLTFKGGWSQRTVKKVVKYENRHPKGYLLFCVVYSYTYRMFKHTHSSMQCAQRSFIINACRVINNRGNRQSTAHLRHPPIQLGFTAESISAHIHPLISLHFTPLSASTSRFLLISQNNPPKKPLRVCVSLSWSAQLEVQARRDQPVWWMQTHMSEISSADKVSTYWFSGFLFFDYSHCTGLNMILREFIDGGHWLFVGA